MELLTSALLQKLDNTKELIEFVVKINDKEYKLFTRKKTAKMKQEELAYLSTVILNLSDDAAMIDPNRVREVSAWRVANFVFDGDGNSLFSIDDLMNGDDAILTAIDEAANKAIGPQNTVEQEAKN